MSNVYDDIFGIAPGARKINSKQKGNTNERTAAKALTVWTGYKFVRVPMSGGLRWKDSGRVAADLICDEPGVDWIFTVETKHLKEIFLQRILKTNSILFTIWEQVMSDAVRVDKLPMALLRVNGMPSGEYYMVLATDMGGSLMSLSVPVLFSGTNGKYCITGFRLSTIIKRLPFSKFDVVVKKSKSRVNLKMYATR